MRCDLTSYIHECPLVYTLLELREDNLHILILLKTHLLHQVIFLWTVKHYKDEPIQ